MTVKKLCWSVLTFLVVALMGMSFVSCGSDDEGDVSSLLETQIKSLLEAGSGQWTIRDNCQLSMRWHQYTFRRTFLLAIPLLSPCYPLAIGLLKKPFLLSAICIESTLPRFFNFQKVL